MKRYGFSLTENLCPVADLRIKQEPVALTDRERAEKLAERLSGEVYPGRGLDASSYGPNSDHLPHGAQLGPAMVPMPPAHPPTPDQKPATPAMWNTKINKASTVSTIDGGECYPLSLRHHERSVYLFSTLRAAQITSLIQRRSECERKA